jgi:hypothetical protein
VLGLKSFFLAIFYLLLVYNDIIMLLDYDYIAPISNENQGGLLFE